MILFSITTVTPNWRAKKKRKKKKRLFPSNVRILSLSLNHEMNAQLQWRWNHIMHRTMRLIIRLHRIIHQALTGRQSQPPLPSPSFPSSCLNSWRDRVIREFLRIKLSLPTDRRQYDR